MAEIREFRADRAVAVDEILLAAFGGRAEADLVRALRDSGDAAIELMACEHDAVAGYICFSPLAVEPLSIRVAALAPVAVAPSRQGEGIGGALIREGLARCRMAGFDAVALLGDPAYYRRFGFTRRAARALESVYSGPAFQALELRDGALSGGPWTVRFARAFDRLD